MLCKSSLRTLPPLPNLLSGRGPAGVAGLLKAGLLNAGLLLNGAAIV
jgi:hypothetical protein